MADIIVDVSLPSPITANVTSQTQALVTNVSVPNPFMYLVALIMHHQFI
jgi:hypothetical protein